MPRRDRIDLPAKSMTYHLDLLLTGSSVVHPSISYCVLTITPARQELLIYITLKLLFVLRMGLVNTVFDRVCRRKNKTRLSLSMCQFCSRQSATVVYSWLDYFASNNSRHMMTWAWTLKGHDRGELFQFTINFPQKPTMSSTETPPLITISAKLKSISFQTHHVISSIQFKLPQSGIRYEEQVQNYTIS